MFGVDFEHHLLCRVSALHVRFTLSRFRGNFKLLKAGI